MGPSFEVHGGIASLLQSNRDPSCLLPSWFWAGTNPFDAHHVPPLCRSAPRGDFDSTPGDWLVDQG